MLFLLFQTGGDRYALEARLVEEIVPLVALKKTPGMPAGVAGICNYHGKLVPVVDLGALLVGEASAGRLSTRLLLVNYPMVGRNELLGLMAEHATETAQLDPAIFEQTGLATPDMPCLGPVAQDVRGLIQWVEVKKILPAPLLARLFPILEEAA